MSLGRREESGRSPAFFRGREFLGLMLFIAIALVGWPILIAQTRRAARPAVDAPTIPVDPRPIRADSGPAFEAIRDKAPSQFREITAYAELLRRARETPPDQLAGDARRDLVYTHFWDRPAAYRGVPVHLQGTLKRGLAYDAGVELTPQKKLYEAWFITSESRGFPYVVVFEEPPPGFALGDDLNAPIVVDAYFFKLLGYRAGDAARAAPMLIGRIWTPAPSPAAPASGGAAEEPLWARSGMIAVVCLAVYAAFRLIFAARGFLRPAKPKTVRGEELDLIRPVNQPTDQDVSNFLRDLETSEDPPRD